MRTVLITIGFLILSAGAVAPSCRAERYTALSLAGYRDRLENLSSAAARLRDHPEEAALLARDLPEGWTVVVEGQRFEVPLDPLRRELEAVEGGKEGRAQASEQIEQRLAAMRADAEALAVPAWYANARAREKLDAILSRREFRGLGGPTWLDRAWERLAERALELLRWLFRPLDRLPRASRRLFWILALIPAGLLAYWLARSLLRRPPPVELALEAAPAATAWQVHLRNARAQAAQGNFREAIRLAYWVAVARLGEQGVWEVDRARTHREYLRLLSSDAPARAPFAEVVGRFERVWYAGRPAASEDFESALAQLENLGCLPHSTPVTAS